MESSDSYILSKLLTWLHEGKKVTMCTVLATWGGAPRPPGAIAVINDGGEIIGSVSGGCVEDDLLDYLEEHGHQVCTIKHYGIDKEQTERLMLPCGGKLDVLLESSIDINSVQKILSAIKARKLIKRIVDYQSGDVKIQSSGSTEALLNIDHHTVSRVFGPQWQILVIGAGEISRFVAKIALMLNYKVIVCDPRESYYNAWDVDGIEVDKRMPDEVVLAHTQDCRSAVVTLTHDPKLDDMALIEALTLNLFYVGALGSNKTNQHRRDRLKLSGLSDCHIARLYGPVGISLGGKSAAEIALSIMAGITVKRYEPQRDFDDTYCVE